MNALWVEILKFFVVFLPWKSQEEEDFRIIGKRKNLWEDFNVIRTQSDIEMLKGDAVLVLKLIKRTEDQNREYSIVFFRF